MREKVRREPKKKKKKKKRERERKRQIKIPRLIDLPTCINFAIN